VHELEPKLIITIKHGQQHIKKNTSKYYSERLWTGIRMLQEHHTRYMVPC